MEYSIRQAKEIISHLVVSGLGFKNGGALTPYLVGDPGIGKTAIVEFVAREHGMKFFPLHLSYREPTDLLGLPMFHEAKDGTKVTTFIPPSFLHYNKDDTVLLFLDELPQAVPTVQNGASQLIHERRVGDVYLPPKTLIVAAGNKSTNRANTFPLGAHLKNRIETIGVGVNPEEWIEDVADPMKLHEAVISYIRRDPGMLIKADPNADSFPSPRSWTKVGQLLSNKTRAKDFVEMAIMNGELGKEAATMFFAHMAIYRGLRDISEIVANPEGCAIPRGNNSAAIMWSEITMLARRVDKSNANAVMTYFGRLPTEIGTVGMRDILRRTVKNSGVDGESLVAGSKAGRDWLSTNGDMIRSANR
jgi:hypothetical protein